MPSSRLPSPGVAEATNVTIARALTLELDRITGTTRRIELV
jgi:hypothetical protein